MTFVQEVWRLLVQSVMFQMVLLQIKFEGINHYYYNNNNYYYYYILFCVFSDRCSFIKMSDWWSGSLKITWFCSVVVLLQDCGLLVQPDLSCGLQPFIKSHASLHTCSSGHQPGVMLLPVCHLWRIWLLIWTNSCSSNTKHILFSVHLIFSIILYFILFIFI